MGANISVQSIDSISSVTNNVMNEIATQINNNVSSYTKSNQVMNVSINNSNIACSVNLTQQAQMSVSTLLENSSKLSNDLASKLDAKIKEELSNKLKQTNEDLNLGQVNTASLNTKSTTYITQNLTTLIKTGITNSVTTDAQGNQYLNFNISNSNITCPPGGAINITQSMAIDQISKNISKNIVENVIKNVVSGGIDKVIEQKAEQLNKGIDVFAMFTVFIIVAVFGLGGFAYLRTGGVFKAAEKGMSDITRETALKIQTTNFDPGTKAYGGTKEDDDADDDYDQDLKLKLALGCGIGIVGGYYGYYLPEKQKIKEKYDTSYLNNI